MDEKKRNACLWGVFILFAVYFIMLFSAAFEENILTDNSQRQWLFLVLLLLAAVFSMNGELRPVQWNKWIAFLEILGGAWIVFIGILHPIGEGYVLFGVSLLTVYPALYIVWNNRKDYETLFDIIAGSNVAVNAVYALYTFTTAEEQYNTLFFELRFKGSTWNSNLFSMIGMTLFCCSLYLAYRKRKEYKKCLFFLMTSAIGMIIVLFGKSRAAVIIVAIAIFVTVFYMVKPMIASLNVKGKKLMLIAVMLVLCIVCISFITDNSSDEASDDESHTVISDRFLIKDKSLNRYTSGRIKIWAAYAPMLNFLGNDVDAINWDEMPVTKNAHAHNNFLEFGYRCGVPVSIIFTALELLACLIAFVYMHSRRCTRDAYLFAIIMTAMFFIDSLIDIATIPCERYAPFFFYLILVIMIDPRANKGTQKEKARVIYKDQNNQ